MSLLASNAAETDRARARHLAESLLRWRTQMAAYDDMYGADLPTTPFCSLRNELRHLITEVDLAIEAAERFPEHPQGD